MTHEEATQRAVALFGPRGACAMVAVCSLTDGCVRIVRSYRVGYLTADAQHFVALGRGATWEAALAAASPNPAEVSP